MLSQPSSVKRCHDAADSTPSAVDLEMEVAGQFDDRADDDEVVVVGVEIVDERLVDLDAVERQVAHVGERRVAGAEVVDDDPRAELTQLARARRG